MLTTNASYNYLKILTEIGRDLAYFPLWWYTRGLVNTFKNIYDFLSERQKSLALLVWIKNIHKPMYGQRDWQGRLVSFLMRFVQIVFRSILMSFWLLVGAAMLLLWVSFPLIAIFEIFFQLYV